MLIDLNENGRAWVVERTETKVVRVSAEENFMMIVGV